MTRPRMPLRPALEVLRAHRRPGDVVIPSMGTAREWMAMGPLDPLDFVYVPSAMGEAPALGLGIALAQPARRVIACNGDGSMLMNLGSFVTLAAADARNLVLIVFDNGVYEVTGAQPVPGAAAGVDFATIAQASGMRAVHHFSSIDAWREGAATALGSPGPVCIVLDVAPVPGAIGPRSPGPAAVRGPEFMRALAAR